MHRVILSLSLLSLCACGPKVSRTIGPDQVGTKYARLTGYFGTTEAAPGGAREEQVPGHLRHELIRDEATLVRVAPSETCFEVTVRSESKHDEPLDQLVPTCEVGDEERSAVVENERITIVDYPYQGTEEVVRADAVASSEYMGLSIQRPAEKAFRVITREATLCCGLHASNTVTLQLDNERREFADYNYKLAFEWKLR